MFLDEIVNLSLDLQVKLLRVLQERRVRRLGGQQDFDVDFRLVSAANESLEKAMNAGRFRQDLFFRLNVVNLVLPPLRQREGDVTLLAEHFVSRLNEAGPKQVEGLAKATLDLLERCPWPGNVRELQNAVESAHSLCQGRFIEPDDLPGRILSNRAGLHRASQDDFEAARRQFEREYLEGLLERCSGNVSRAAQIAGIHRSTLQRLLRRNDLRSVDFRA